MKKTFKSDVLFWLVNKIRTVARAHTQSDFSYFNLTVTYTAATAIHFGLGQTVENGTASQHTTTTLSTTTTTTKYVLQTQNSIYITFIRMIPIFFFFLVRSSVGWIFYTHNLLLSKYNNNNINRLFIILCICMQWSWSYWLIVARQTLCTVYRHTHNDQCVLFGVRSAQWEIWSFCHSLTHSLSLTVIINNFCIHHRHCAHLIFSPTDLLVAGASVWLILSAPKQKELWYYLCTSRGYRCGRHIHAHTENHQTPTITHYIHLNVMYFNAIIASFCTLYGCTQCV